MWPKNISFLHEVEYPEQLRIRKQVPYLKT